MAGANIKSLDSFLRESKTLVENMLDILSKCEGNFSQVKSLERYGMEADRIMGAARSWSLLVGDPVHPINKVADYAALCKTVGYKAANIQDNEQFYDICVALLLDGTEVLQAMLEGLKTGDIKVKDFVSATFLDRLRWVSSHFTAEHGIVGDIHKGKNTKLTQDDIDVLLKKLGFN